MTTTKYIKRSLNLSFIVGFLLVFTSCTKNFEDINTDPNGVTSVPTTYLLTSAQQKLITQNSSLNFNKTFMLWAQYWTQRETTNRSRYDLSVDTDWNSFYSIGLPDLNTIIEFNSGDKKDYYAGFGDNNNQIAVAMILKAWTFSLMTDTWGDIPYSQALNSEFAFPAYDKQSDIYPDLIAQLKAADALINTSNSGFKSGDLMYAGNMSKWKKFANSLRARLAMRMSKVAPSEAETAFKEAIQAGVFSANSEEAIINFQSAETYANPLYLEFLTQNWTLPTELLINRMIAISDPRLAIYADPNTAAGEYVGLPYGLSDAASQSYALTNLSKIGAKPRSATFPSILMSYSEVLFLQAEATKKGWLAGGNAEIEALYKAAITANMQFWGVSSTNIDNYLLQSEVVYNSANWNAQLGEQKWLALYTQGAQAFFEWRRLGQPNIQIPTSALSYNLTQMPRRFFYATGEKSLNGTQLQAAITQMGGDLLTTRMWIDPADN
jgi:hypothetical protein